MEAVRNCFGGKRHALPDDDEDDDRDPLLPRDAHPNSHHFQTAERPSEPEPTRVGNGNAKGKGRTVIDFPDPDGSEGDSEEGSEQPLLNKLVDAFAALSAGKLPTQDQISRILQKLLHSDLLNLDQSPEADSQPAFLSGTGPASRRGRKVLEDVRNLLQAGLQFGMEKNGKDSFLYLRVEEYKANLKYAR